MRICSNWPLYTKLNSCSEWWCVHWNGSSSQLISPHLMSSSNNKPQTGVMFRRVLNSCLFEHKWEMHLYILFLTPPTSVVLSVCAQNYMQATEQVLMRFLVKVIIETRNIWSDFGTYLKHNHHPGMIKACQSMSAIFFLASGPSISRGHSIIYLKLWS